VGRVISISIHLDPYESQPLLPFRSMSLDLITFPTFSLLRRRTIGTRLVRAHRLHRGVAISHRSRGRAFLQARFEGRQQPRLVGPRVPHERQPLRAPKPPAASSGLTVSRAALGGAFLVVVVGVARAFGASGVVERVRVELKLDRPQDHLFVHDALVRLEPAVQRGGPRELRLLRCEVPALERGGRENRRGREKREHGRGGEGSMRAALQNTSPELSNAKHSAVCRHKMNVFNSELHVCQSNLLTSHCSYLAKNGREGSK